MGLCLPDRCKATDLNSFKTYLVPMLNAELPDIFEGAKGLQQLQQLQLTADDIDFVDTERENAEATQFDFLSFTFMFIVGCMAIAVVVSTIASLHWMRQRKKEALEKLNEDGKADVAP